MPPNVSRSRASSRTGTSVSRDSASAVSRARLRSEETIACGRRAASSRAARAAWSRPTSSSSTSVWPWNRSSTFHPVWPCRQRTHPWRRGRVMRGLRCTPAVRTPRRWSGRVVLVARPRRTDVVGQLDERAVLPDPLERVVDPLLGVLDVDDHVDVVEQHPAALALALAAYRLGAELPQPLLDRVDDRLDLAVVGRRAQDEAVGDHQLLAHVEGEDVVGELVGGRLGGGDGQLAGAVGDRSSGQFSHAVSRREVLAEDDDHVGDRLAPVRGHHRRSSAAPATCATRCAPARRSSRCRRG